MAWRIGVNYHQMESVETRVLRAVQPFAQVELRLDSNLRDAGMGSLDIMCSVQAVQDEFDHDVNDEQFRDIKTVRDIAELFVCSPKAA